MKSEELDLRRAQTDTPTPLSLASMERLLKLSPFGTMLIEGEYNIDIVYRDYRWLRQNEVPAGLRVYFDGPIVKLTVQGEYINSKNIGYYRPTLVKGGIWDPELNKLSKWQFMELKSPYETWNDAEKRILGANRGR